MHACTHGWMHDTRGVSVLCGVRCTMHACTRWPTCSVVIHVPTKSERLREEGEERDQRAREGVRKLKLGGGVGGERRRKK